MRSKILLALLAVCSAFVLAACGGDDDTTTSVATTTAPETTTTETTTEDVSADDYEAEASAILDPYIIEVEQAGAAAASPESAEAYLAAVEDIQEIQDTAAADLAAITPPAEVAGAHDQLIASLEDFSAALDPIKEAAANGDPQALESAAGDLTAVLEDFAIDVTAAEAEFQAAGIELNLN